MQEYRIILEKLNKFYSNCSSIEIKRNILEVKPPLFLDDFNQLTIFISRDQTKINFYTNLMPELENSLLEKLVSNNFKGNDVKISKEDILNKTITKQNIIKNFLKKQIL